jgi:hypothetical protein
MLPLAIYWGMMVNAPCRFFDSLDRAGTQLSKIQQQLGHSNIQTTRDNIGELEGDDIADTIRATSVVGEIIRDAD